MIRINSTRHISDEGKVLVNRVTGERSWFANGNIENFDEVDATEEEKAARAEYISPKSGNGNGRPSEKTATAADMKAKLGRTAAFLAALSGKSE